MWNETLSSRLEPFFCESLISISSNNHCNWSCCWDLNMCVVVEYMSCCWTWWNFPLGVNVLGMQWSKLSQSLLASCQKNNAIPCLPLIAVNDGLCHPDNSDRLCLTWCGTRGPLVKLCKSRQTRIIFVFRFCQPCAAPTFEPGGGRDPQRTER